MASKYDALARIIIQNGGWKGKYCKSDALYYQAAFPAEGRVKGQHGGVKINRRDRYGHAVRRTVSGGDRQSCAAGI